jgi:hypothetical protein
VSKSLTKPNRQYFELLGAPRTWINLPIAALEPCCKADHFEYNIADIREYFVLPKWGWDDFCGLVGEENAKKVKITKFLKDVFTLF